MKIVREEIDYKKQMENNNKNMKKSKETDTVIAVDPTYADAMEQDKKAEEKVGEIMKKKKEEQKSIETPDPSTGKPLKKNMYTKQAELDESLFDDGEGEEVEEGKNPTKLPEDVFTMVYDFIFDGLHKTPASIKGLEDVEDVVVGAEKYFQDVQNFTNIGVQIKDDEKSIAEYVKKIADALGFSTSEKRYERGVKNGDYVLFVEIPKDVAVMKTSRFLNKNESLKESRFPRFELDIWVPGSGGDDERERTLIRTDDIGEVLETIYKTELDSGEAFLFSDLRRNFELDQEYSQEDMYNDLKDRLGDEFDFSDWDEHFEETNVTYSFEESKKCNEAKKNPKFDGMTIEEIFWDVVGKKFDVFDDKGYFTDEAEKHYNEVASLYGEDAFDKLCDEVECCAESKKCKDGKCEEKKLTETIEGEDILDDLVDRAILNLKDGIDSGRTDVEAAVERAIDDGLIHNDDILSLGIHYDVVDTDKILSDIYDTLTSDLIGKVTEKLGETYKSTDESLKEGKKPVKESKKLTEDAKIYISLSDYRPWSGAVDTFEKIRKEDKMDELDAFIEEMYPDGLTDTELNDLLWFEPEYVFDSLGIDYEDEDEEDEDEDDELELDFEEEDEEETDEE